MGAYTVLASKVCNSKTIAFEPIKQSFKRLLDQIRINNIEQNVTAKEIGLGNHNGTLFFTNNLNAMNKVAFVNKSHNVVEVQISRLDDEILNSTSCVIKIDVEGYEYNVVEGCQQLLRSKNALAMIIELNSSSIEFGHSNIEIHELIIQNNYTPIEYNPLDREITPLTSFNQNKGNTIYVRDVDEVKQLVRNGKQFNIKTGINLII